MTTRSKRGVHLCKITDVVVSILRSGRAVSEAEIMDLCTTYPGDARKSLRRVHQCYRQKTNLILINGLWVLTPVPEARL
jgi:hypothetical protein